MSGVGHSFELARVDVLRTVRKQTNLSGGGTSVLGTIVYVLFVGVATLGGGYLGIRAGELLATGSVDLGAFSAVEIVRGILAVFWLVLVLIYTVRGVGKRGTLASPTGTLTVVPTGEALVGMLLAEYAYLLAWVTLPSVGLGVGMAIGSGVVWPAVAVPVGVAAVGLGSVGLGYPLGVGIRHIATRFEFVARHKGALIVLAFVVYFLALSSGAWNELMVRLFEPMQASPIGWYADLGLLGSPGVGASVEFAVGSIVLTVIFGAIAIVGGTWIAQVHWFSDPALAGAGEATVTEEDRAPGIERRLEPLLGPAAAALVTLSWRRAIRAPLKLLYAFYPMLFLAGMFADIVQSGRIPVYFPFALLVAVTWAAGVIFTLNPLGDQGAAVSSTLLSRVDGRTFVRSHLLAGLIVAIPLGTVTIVAVGVLSPIDDATLVALAIGTPILMSVGAALSVGVGMAFPRFEETQVTQSMKTVVPSRWAFVLFSLYVFETAVAAAIIYEEAVGSFVAGLLSWLLPFGLEVTPGMVYWAAIIAIGPLVLAPAASYRYAIGRFNRFTLE